MTAKFLTVSPRDELVLTTVEGENDPVDTVELKNEGSKAVVYKIKITSPEKFRVRPCTGTVAAGKTESIRVHLQNEYRQTINRERMLIMAVEVVEATEGAEFSSLWKNADESSKLEWKLKCRLATSLATPSSSPALPTPLGNHTFPSFDFNDSLRQQISELRKKHETTNLWIRLILGLQTLTLLFMFVLYFSIKAPLQHTPASQISPVNVEPIDVDSDL